MKWIRITIETSREAEDALSNLLMEIGSGGVQAEDSRSNPGKVTLISYFPQDDTIGEKVSEIKKLLGNMRQLGINVGRGKISIGSIDESDWTMGWKEFFKPIPVGKRILIYPSWEDISDFKSRDIIVQIDPGMAFGTGKHSTTILPLELLENVIKGGEKVVDVGTGSGILSIAAVKLGAEKALAIDFNLESTAIARDNAKKNSVSDKIDVICGDLFTAIKGRYDVIVSNIYGKVIMSMIPDLRSYLAPGGCAILSGILDSEKSQVEGKLRDENLSTLEIRQHEEWVAFLVKVEQ